jgi:hypothetical protein
MPLKPVKKEAGNFDGNRGLMSGLGILLDFGPKVKWYESEFLKNFKFFIFVSEFEACIVSFKK